jgi:hypothetical protein
MYKWKEEATKMMTQNLEKWCIAAFEEGGMVAVAVVVVDEEAGAEDELGIERYEDDVSVDTGMASESMEVDTG